MLTNMPVGSEPMGAIPQTTSSGGRQSFFLLVADDDPEDCLFIQEAIRENGFSPELHFVHDGEELLEYLSRSGRDGQPTQRPDLLLLDLNMPKLDGREALRRIKTDLRWRSLPVVVLTTSGEENDVQTCYQLGAASFVCKPASYRGWLETLGDLCRYWFERVRLLSPEK